MPLGSLTQRVHQVVGHCRACGSERLTRLGMQLGDGGAVDFVSCQHCEHRQWEQGGQPIAVADVLTRSSRP